MVSMLEKEPEHTRAEREGGEIAKAMQLLCASVDQLSQLVPKLYERFAAVISSPKAIAGVQESAFTTNTTMASVLVEFAARIDEQGLSIKSFLSSCEL